MSTNSTRPKPQRNLSLKDSHAGCFRAPATHDAHVNRNGDTDKFQAKVGPTGDGQIVTVIDSGVVHSINHKNCQSSAEGYKQIVATLFYTTYTTKNTTEEVSQYGQFISQAALFDFISRWDKLMVPWRRWDSSHKCLERSEEARVVQLVLLMPEMLSLEDLRRHEELAEYEAKWSIEIVLQPHDVFRRHKRLAVFDMDSTLIEQEVIDEIARFVGVEKEVSAITARAMNGELDFTQSLQARVALLKGVPSDVFEKLKPVITFTPGARELCKALKALGFKLAVLSGGFIPLANHVMSELGLDYAYANQLVISEDGTELTGELTGPIVHAERKALLLEEIAQKESIHLKQTVAIGDGANDLIMMWKAGLGIAFNAKPKVQAEAPCRLNSPTLKDVLYILGFAKGEQDDLLALSS
ncbi:HAD-like domain-containing protein [Terfezia claveryi]|nr:HAD-like domain-containing protein [Terfezia claveryi]